MLSRSPRHGCASTYSRSGLFRDLGSFAELEHRIEQLPTEKERGDAFEVFVEAYLSTDEMAQAADVWVVGKVPGEVRRQLNLPSRDYGYDGVLRTKLGELVPYQAKFRSGRTSLPYAELATFFGISEKAVRRVVLTNSIAISAVAESRTSFQTTRGGDLDRLDAAQLAAIDGWIAGIAPAPLTREPRPHQRAALNDIAKELAARDRATVVMACGTGKTLIALWAAENVKPTRVLVLVPSLNLLRQTLHEWAKWTNWGERFRYLCVCSDPNVATGIDAIEIRPEDTDFPIRTDPAIVRQFLDAGNDAVSVVFCTYQSAPVVGEAVKGIQPFDLGIFDEAHKTTGREGTRYAFALTDKNLPVRKRLFLTATPRHYDIRKRDADGDFSVVSMNDEAVYGRVAHRLSFSEAARQKIIVPYKVIISVVDSDMINNALLDQSEVAIKGDPVRAKWVAHQIALKHAVEEHNLRRVITFHTSIRAAAAFASDDSEGVGIHLPQFQRFHVSGVQPTAERDEHMREFARANRGVISNARCLTEGVDVPSVDMVAFMNPRRSRVDIVQAVGRAMRTSGDGKACGYVFVPLFLELRQGETLDEALERSDFDEIAQVLNAMRDNDDELSDIIQALRIDKGMTGGFDESRLRDKLEVLGPQVQLSALSAAIRSRLINELSFVWDERFGQLVAYKQTYGDCNVPTGWKENPQLATWCGTQRVMRKAPSRKRGKLSPDRTKRLEQIGFQWEQLISAWEEMFALLVTYKQTYGDVDVTRHRKANPSLAKWCIHQRGLYNNHTLPRDRAMRMDQLGFVWNRFAAKWEEGFRHLKDFADRESHADVPLRFETEDGYRLGAWVAAQRRYAGKKMEPARKARLDTLPGWVWDALAEQWEAGFRNLKEFVDREGHTKVPRNYKTADGDQVGVWLKTQKQYRNILSSERKTRLEALPGWSWDPNSDAWEEGFRKLKEFADREGTAKVPHKYKTADGYCLGQWVGNQRVKEDKLPSERKTRLEALPGWSWDPFSDLWEDGFRYLKEFADREGHSKVPSGYKTADGYRLGAWVVTQRTEKDSRAPEYKARLEALPGWSWNTQSDHWEEGYRYLKEFADSEGHVKVPYRYKTADGYQLGSWVAKQRKAIDSMPPERKARMEELRGWVWRVDKGYAK